MADFDEGAIRPPSPPIETIRAGDISPWMVWIAAGAISVLALLGLYLGIRGGHPASDVGLTLARGEVLNPATAAAATPAIGLPKDQQWSTLSGPEILPKVAPPTRTAASDDSDSGDEDSAEPAAAAAVVDEPDPTAAPDIAPTTPDPTPATPTP
jgi:hypothetical protein